MRDVRIRTSVEWYATGIDSGFLKRAIEGNKSQWTFFDPLSQRLWQDGTLNMTPTNDQGRDRTTIHAVR